MRKRKLQARRAPAARPAQTPDHFVRMIELIPDAVLLAGWDGSIHAANRVAGRMFGYGRKGLIGRPIEDLIPERLRKTHVGHRARYSRSPRIRPMGTGRELVAQRKDGSVFPVEIGLSPIGRGNRREILSIIRDISDLVRNRDELRESELRYRGLVELSPEATLVHVEGKILFANKAAADLLGAADPSELLGSALIDYVPEEHKAEVLERTRRQQPLGSKLPPLMIRARRADGREVLLDSLATRTPYKGMVATQVILRDMTERERARVELLASREQLRELSAYLQRVREEERTAIAREIHDELGQALTALKMDLAAMTDMVKSTPNIPERIPIENRAASMATVIDTTIKSVRRISTELRPVLLDSLGLGAAIAWQAEEFESRTGIPCRLTVTPDDLTADGERSTAIFRIFQEVLTNITRHAGAKHVEGSLRHEAGAFVLEVRDDGKGISEEDMNKSKSFGLVGMKERALLFGGTVSISGAPGRGSTVIVTIPANDGART